MTSADTEAMQALQELLNERQRYEGWLRALTERQGATPAHVYSRVHTDYTLRLERVMQRLSERTEQLRSTVDTMSARLATLQSKESDRIDVRHEAELRAAVGEHSEEEWARLRSDADTEIETIATERKGVEDELAGLERIIALTKAPIMASATETPSSEPTPSHVADASPSVDTKDTNSGDPSIEDFVADWPVRHVEASAGAQSDGIAEVPEVDAAPAAMAAKTAPSPFAPPSVTPSADTTPVADSRREQEKTLKCPECGAPNYATEWYCERCGGELATF